MSSSARGGEGFRFRGARSPLVGRGDDLALLERAMERAIEYHAPQLVTVVGNLGVGKSRLVAEWLDRLSTQTKRRVQIYRGRAAEGAASCALVSRLLRDRFRLDGSEAESDAAERVRAVLQDVFGDPRVAEVIHFLGRYLPVVQRASPFVRAIDDQRQHDDIARAVLKRFLELDAERAPLVLAFDDLHVADDDSVNLLSQMAESLGGSPVVLVAATRPDLFVRHPRWGAGNIEHTRIELGPLARADAELLLRHLLSRAESIPQSIVADACEKTSGNPFFVEELVRVFVADGIFVAGANDKWRIDLGRARRVQLPITIEEAVQARIGSLSAEERDLLEQGATFGSVFWTGAVTCLRRLGRDDPARKLDDGQRAAVEASLADLVEREYLLKMPDSTFAGEGEYAFKHNLERDLVSRMTAPDRARRYSLFAAQWMEMRLDGKRDPNGGPAGSEEQLEFLATLYGRGGNPHRAAAAWVAAGNSARARYANDTAVELYARALALLDRDDALGRLEALHNLGDVTSLTGRTREALSHFEEMLRAAWLLDGQAKAGAAHGRIGRCYRTLGEYDKAEYHLGLALTLFTRANDHRGVAGAEDDLGKVSFLRGDYQRALDRHSRALDLRRALGDPRSIALAVHNLAQVQHASGNHSEAMARFDEALALRREIDDRPGVAQSLMEMGAVWGDRSAHDRALAVFKEAITLTREIGDRVTEAQVGTRIGETLLRAGRHTEAAAALKQAVEVAENMGSRLVQAEASRLLGETLLEMSELSAARKQCDVALDLAVRVGSPAHRGLAHRALATVIARAGANHEERAQADDHFRSAVELLGDVGAEPELMRAYSAYGDFLEETGDPDGAQTVRERAQEILCRLREAARLSVDVEILAAPMLDPNQIAARIPEPILQVARALSGAGFQAHVVGGAIRDLYLGRDAHDFDLATSAHPAEVTRLFGRARTIPTGEKHGTVTVLVGEGEARVSVEVTTFRGEGAYSDGRRPDSVEFTDSLTEDLRRRDFTVNAIAFDPIARVVADPFHGLDDLAAKRLRAVGDAVARFGEDGLRVMRAVRFAAQLGFALDPATEAAIPGAIPVFRKVSMERVRDELLKILAAPLPSVALRLMQKSGLLAEVIPELMEGVGFPQNRYHKHDVFEHTLHAVDATQGGPIVRLGALLHDVAKPRTAAPKVDSPTENSFFRHEQVGAEMADAIGRRLKLANHERERVVALVGHHMFWYSPEWSDATVRRFIGRVGTELLPDLFALREGDVRARGRGEEPGSEIDELKRRIEEEVKAARALKVSDLAVGGADVMRVLGCPPGRVVGEVLRRLLERVIDEPALNTRETLEPLIAVAAREPAEPIR